MLACDAYRLRNWNLETGEVTDEALAPESTFDAIALSPGATQLSAITYPTAHSWRMSNLGTPLRKWDTETKLKSLAYHPSGEAIVLGDSHGRITLLPLAESTEPLELGMHEADYSRALRFSADGSLLASISLREALIYSTADWSRLTTVLSTSRIFDVEFAPDEDAIYLATVSGDVMRRKVSRDSTELRGDGGRKLFGTRRNIERMAISADSTRIACGLNDGRVVVVTVQDGRELFARYVAESDIRGLAYERISNRVVAADATGMVVRMDAETGKSQRVIASGHSISAIALSPDERQLAVAYKTLSRLDCYAWPSGKLIRQIPLADPAAELDFCDSSLLLVMSTQLDVVDTRTGESLGRDVQPGAGFANQSVSGDGAMAVVAENLRGVSLRRLPGLEVFERLVTQVGNLKRVALSRDARHVATLSDRRQLQVWDLATLEPLVTLDVEGAGPPRSVQFSQDGRCLFFNDGHTIVVWDGR